MFLLITWLYETWKVHTYPPKVEQVTLTIFIVGFAYLVDKVVPGPRTADKMKDPRFFSSVLSSYSHKIL